MLLSLLALSCTTVSEWKTTQPESRDLPYVWTSDYRLELSVQSTYPLRIAGLVTQRRDRVTEQTVYQEAVESTFTPKVFPTIIGYPILLPLGFTLDICVGMPVAFFNWDRRVFFPLLRTTHGLDADRFESPERTNQRGAGERRNRTVRRVLSVTQSNSSSWLAPTGDAIVELLPLWNGLGGESDVVEAVRIASSGHFEFDGESWVRECDLEGFLIVRGKVRGSSQDFDAELRIDLSAVAQAVAEFEKNRNDEAARVAQQLQDEASRRQSEEANVAAERAAIDGRIDALLARANSPADESDDLILRAQEDLDLAGLLAKPHRNSPEDQALAIEALERAVSNATQAGSAELLKRALQARAKLESN